MTRSQTWHLLIDLQDDLETVVHKKNNNLQVINASSFWSRLTFFDVCANKSSKKLSLIYTNICLRQKDNTKS